jgi:hypothetical protein
MRKLLFIFLLLPFISSAQIFSGGTGPLRQWNNTYIDNNASKAFTNLRLHNLLAGMIDWIDSARAGSGGVGLGMDTLWSSNDSTLIYRNNGLFRSVILRGVYDWRNKVDTILSPNDSTLSFTINHRPYSVILRGNIQNINWCNVKNSGADISGTTDATPFIQSLINNGCKYIYLPAGVYLINSTIQMLDSVVIKGDGRTTKLIVNGNYPAFKCSFSQGGQKAQFIDISFVGNRGIGTVDQEGILMDSIIGVYINNVAGYKLSGYTIHSKRNGYCCTSYPTPTGVLGNIISNCWIDSCYGGISLDTLAEYNTVNNTTVTKSNIGVFVAGGNARINSCNLSGNAYGAYFTGGSNNGHGIMTGCTVNHNSVSGIYMDGVTNGFEFAGNMLYAGGQQFTIINSSLLSVHACDIVPGKITITGSTNVKFSDCRIPTPTWTVTGTLPSIMELGKSANTLTFTDASTNAQFNLAHSNNVVDLSTTSPGKIRLNDTTVVAHILAGSETAGDTLNIMGTTNTSSLGRIYFGQDNSTIGVLRSVYDASNGKWGIGVSNSKSMASITGIHIRNSRSGFNAEIRLQNDTACSSCSSRLTFLNEKGTLGAQMFYGTTSNAFAPHTFLMHGNDTNGIKIVSGTCTNCDIEFAGSTNIGVSSFGRFKGNGNLLVASSIDNGLAKFQLTGNATFSALQTGGSAPSTVGATNLAIVDNNGMFSFGQAVSATPTITTGTAAPVTTPVKVGDIYVDTANKKLYFAAGNSSSADWIIAN